MPAHVAAVFSKLVEEMVDCHLYWKLYRDLFAVSAEQIDTINATVPAFAFAVQRAFYDTVCLALARLTDPEESCGKPNLSFAYLAKAISPYLGVSPHGELLRKLEIARSAVSPLRVQRNRRIAHNDLKCSMAAAFAGTSREEVEKALEASRDFMNLSHLAYGGAPMAYERVYAEGGSDSLMSCLEQIQQMHRLRNQFLTGEIADSELVAAIIKGVTK
jgi:hypothetical protein